MNRQLRGHTNYHDGQAAEDIAAAHYIAQGGSIVARRWRGKAGEIDIVVDMGGTVVFAEVKKSRDFGRAAGHLGIAQLARIMRAADEYLGGLPTGLSTEARIDLVLVNGVGESAVIENVSLWA